MKELLLEPDITALAKFYDNVWEDHDLESLILKQKSSKYLLNVLGVEFDKEKKLLDYGCGCGLFLTEAAKRVTCWGSDISKIALLRASNHIPDDVTLIRMYNEKLAFTDSYFDYIYCLGTLEHIYYINEALKEMHRLLNNDGKICFYLPTIEREFTQLNERVGAAQEWIAILEPYFSLLFIDNYFDESEGHDIFVCQKKV